ncbi:protein-glutamate O-methyltransferase CheR [Methylocapsa polymorpha]|uniref:Protein-glutamate O-methyltransferase CheR n=1 Tax=Methylocapsa polymorpha TaxID=3080828 RepID=A0ABZ0HVB2_9HYPH|nr:protein-glutamate O-methyltransferase CheR [Methylocapsa sp. RX1]
MTASDAQEENDLELDLLLEAIYRTYHYDFRGYARSSLRRSVARGQSALGSPTITHLLDRILHESEAFAELLRYLTIQVSEFFRDPGYFRLLREKVMPHLATYPSLRIWVAGCGTGEEAYSIAIILHEEGLLERSLIYATDIDMESLKIAEAGVYELGRLRGFSENYFRSGGRASLSDYYAIAPSRAAFTPMLRKHILFSDHSLATDAAFAEMQLVSCRNVLIYFDRELQDRTIGLFRESLCPRGFLGLGPKETLTFSDHANSFEALANDERIYRMK